ncbi:hypothetical protein IT575_10875 [bacterium]|nr:hypothetical protein [bacterium]
MKRLNIAVLVVLLLSLLASACGGGGNNEPDPQPGDFSIVSAANGALSISGPAGSADPGTTVSLQAPASGSGTAAADGSVSFSGNSGGAASVVVIHVRDGVTQQASETPVSLASRVTAPLFSTGAGPNDLLLANDSLYVANSLDNSVVRHSLSGAQQGSHSFPLASSPSYLELEGFDDTLWVACNGDNHITGLDPLSLEPVAGSDFVLDHTGLDSLAFIGPGRPQAYEQLLVVPLAAISSFGSPTVYDSGGIGATLTRDGTENFRFNDDALNGQTVEIIPTTSFFAMVSAGSIQFDDNFVPSAASSSFLTIGSTSGGDVHAPAIRSSLDLGAIGASEMALTPDGRFAYIADQLDGKLYKVDLSNLDQPQLVRGIANPIVLTEEFTYISDLELTPDGKLLLATSFNTDELFVIDTASDTVSPAPYPGPFDVSLDPGLLAGTIGVETDGSRAWVLYAIGNAVGEVDLF